MASAFMSTDTFSSTQAAIIFLNLNFSKAAFRCLQCRLYIDRYRS